MPFLRLHLPILQNEIMHFARLAKVTPAQYVRQNESLILDALATNNNTLATGEPFEIFQPTSQERSETMGVKEQSAKRRLSPEGRKENSPDEKLVDGPTTAKRHQPVISPSINSRSAAGVTPALLPVSSHHPPHPSLHLPSAQARALLEERDGPALYHNGLANGRGLPHGPDHERSAHPYERERERYAERYEKEFFGRPVPSFYSELAHRSYAEELSRDMEEEWKNIYTVSDKK